MASDMHQPPSALRPLPRPLRRPDRNRHPGPSRRTDLQAGNEAATRSIDRQIGERVARHRRAAMICVHAAARRSGLSPEDYLAGERGKRRFQAIELYSLAHYFGVRLSVFFRGLSLR